MPGIRDIVCKRGLSRTTAKYSRFVSTAPAIFLPLSHARYIVRIQWTYNLASTFSSAAPSSRPPSPRVSPLRFPRLLIRSSEEVCTFDMSRRARVCVCSSARLVRRARARAPVDRIRRALGTTTTKPSARAKWVAHNNLNGGDGTACAPVPKEGTTALGADHARHTLYIAL